MPCLGCRGNMTGLIAMAAREGKGPTRDEPVMIHGLGAGGFVPDGFLSPRLCMLCGVIFCPPTIDRLDVPGPGEVQDPLEVARTGRVTAAESVGPEDFPGSDEESHFVAQTLKVERR